ncbi:hypothetical protein [Clostridium sp. ZS1]|uniref:hypothetical protein n=1 Tax=Clostridium sp. ZS1 TaxID=2949989 RepID=UPI002079EED6|nr:hypothetical protein [Clostridium sp. ZS1]
MNKSVCTHDTFIKSGFLSVSVDAFAYWHEYKLLSFYYKDECIGTLSLRICQLKLKEIKEDSHKKSKKVKIYEVVKNY